MSLTGAKACVLLGLTSETAQVFPDGLNRLGRARSLTRELHGEFE